MCRRTVVALVIVVRQDLPVVRPILIPGVIVDIVIKVEVLVSFLLIDSSVLLLPRDLWSLLAIEVNPYEPVLIDLNMDREQTIAFLLETREFLISGGFGELPVKSIRPAVVFASKDLRSSFLAGDDREASMSADVVKAVDVPLAVLDEHESKTSNFVGQPVSGVRESRLVCCEHPLL